MVTGEAPASRGASAKYPAFLHDKTLLKQKARACLNHEAGWHVAIVWKLCFRASSEISQAQQKGHVKRASQT